MCTNQQIDEYERQIALRGAEYLRRIVPQIARRLEDNPQAYWDFGAYWWAVKSALKIFVKNDRWYCGASLDQDMLKYAWHGSLFRTVLAAVLYEQERLFPTDVHTWVDRNGELRKYRLRDADAPTWDGLELEELTAEESDEIEFALR